MRHHLAMVLPLTEREKSAPWILTTTLAFAATLRQCRETHTVLSICRRARRLTTANGLHANRVMLPPRQTPGRPRAFPLQRQSRVGSGGQYNQWIGGGAPVIAGRPQFVTGRRARCADCVESKRRISNRTTGVRRSRRRSLRPAASVANFVETANPFRSGVTRACRLPQSPRATSACRCRARAARRSTICRAGCRRVRQVRSRRRIPSR